MKLKSLNKYICFLISFFFIQPLFAEEEIDIWKKEIKKKSQSVEQENNISTIGISRCTTVDAADIIVIDAKLFFRLLNNKLINLAV